MKKEKIVLGMSGGVDSSVAALLLQKSGYDVYGVFMKNWDDKHAICSAEDDYADAISVCKKLNIPLKKIDYTNQYKDKVFKQFLDDHVHGLTPNPDILCNKEIKFEVFQNYAKEIGATKIATGHYADKYDDSSISYLKKATDLSKDQSYFLHQLGQSELKDTIFPLGKILKKDVRIIAKKYSLINHNKKDSTGICFIGERKYNDFVGQYLTVDKGNIKSLDGEILGTHSGHIYFTIGQRKGLGIGARLTSEDKPWYVVKKDIDNNIVFVAQGENHPALFSEQIIVDHINWINLKPKTFPKKYYAKVRYRDKDKLCTIFSLDNDTYLIKFKSKQKAITPGQSIVLYNEDGICAGGGIITRRDIPYLKENI
ncbi:tRNA 2-thiouridine(34) synthase MnmA [Candidatus Marinimicrobia bacterium]|nr:tRNA 2-thiouridine(34) synthase MnmA [Candidatus Neomarinimicrobiota bacterium]